MLLANVLELRNARATLDVNLHAGVHAEIRGDKLRHAGSADTEGIYRDPIALSAMLEHLRNCGSPRLILSRGR